MKTRTIKGRYDSEKQTLEKMAIKNGIDPLHVEDAPEKTAYALLPLVWGCDEDADFCAHIIQQYGPGVPDSLNIELDSENGYRVFDPFRQIVENEYLDSSGWTHWSHEEEN